jgi:DNA-binding GntR family transcriptional regulator
VVAPLGRVRRVQLWESVAAELRRAILVGELKPGEHLVEAELATRMHVSRGPVREALRRLEFEALVRVNPNGRTLVIGQSREGIAQLYDARRCLESHALHVAAARADATDIPRLQSLLGAMVTAWRDNRNNVVNELDLSFHRELVVLSRNEVLIRLWETLRPQIHALLEITNITNPRVHSIADKHQRILDAVAAGDGEQAVSCLASHLAEAEEVLVARLEQASLVDLVDAGVGSQPIFFD